MAVKRILGGLWLLFPIAALAASGDVHEFKLDNGLKLIVKEDHRAPVVVSQVWYKVGASYEHDGITGISHVLEHMMFKGTEQHPPGEFSRIIAEHGGKENAFTGRDYTAYFQQLEKSRLPISFELEADRMRNLLLPEAEFAKEIQVVMEERRLRTEDDPQSLTYEHFNAVAHLNGPYHHPIVGWMDDLEALTLADVRRWYDRWYAPNNATVVVVGEVEPEAVHELAKAHFGPLEAAEIAPPKAGGEVRQRGERRIEVKAPAQVPYLLMGYKVPPLRTIDEPWEAYALEVLAGILDGGASARLPRHLVRGQEVAASAGARYSLYSRYDTLLMLSGRPSQGHTLDELQGAIEEQLQRLREAPVGAQELERIKAQVVADEVYERDSMFFQAMQIGILETVGLGWQVMEEYEDEVRAITAEQVQKVAKKYLDPDRRTVAVLKPEPGQTGQQPPPTPNHGGPPHAR